jgi:DME family drug/metabolite transporter
MVLGGTIGPAQVLVGDAVGPIAMAGWRHLIGGLVMCLVAALCYRRAYRSLRGRRVWILLVLGGVLSACDQAAFLGAVSLTGGAIGTVVAVATVPLFTGIAARWFDRERLTAGWVVGSLIAVAGCAVLLLPGAGARVNVAGLGLGVLSGLIFGCYTVVSGRLTKALPNVFVSTGVTMLVGAALLLPAVLAGSGGLADARTGALVAWLSLVGAVTYVLYTAGLKHISANLAGTLNLGEPLAAALISTAVLGEHLSGPQWVACGVMLCGILVATITFSRTTIPIRRRSGIRSVGDGPRTPPRVHGYAAGDGAPRPERPRSHSAPSWPAAH